MKLSRRKVGYIRIITQVFIKSVFEAFDRIATDYMRRERVPYIDYSIEKEVFRLFRSEALTNDFKSVISGVAFPVDNKIIANINIIKALEHFENLDQVSAQSSFF